MPKPKRDETESDYMARCVPKVLEEGTAENRKQAVAICYSMWEDKDKEADTEDEPCEAETCDECSEEVKAGCKKPHKREDKSVWTGAYVSSLPDSAFLFVEAGGAEGNKGKRHFPYRDASGKIDVAHLRNAIARIPQSNAPGLTPEKKRALQERARKLLAEQSKSLIDRISNLLKGLFGLTTDIDDTEGNGANEVDDKASNAADYIESRIHQNFTVMADDLFGWGQLSREERIALSGLIGDSLDVFHSGLQQEVFADLRVRRPQEEVSATPSTKDADNLPDSKEGAATLPEVKEVAESENLASGSRFFIFKAGETWRWLAVFTNRYRDRDNPPEILTDAAHRDFEKAVDSGEWPMPELWPWHVPHRIGVSDRVAYDDRGFMLATGVFDDKQYAEYLSTRTDLGVSHGMPTKEIRRDKDDSTLIIRYRSREISVLPMDNAANPFTGFLTMEGRDMGLSKDKEEFLRGLVGEEKWPSVEAMLSDKSKEVEGVEYKAEDTTATDVTEMTGTITVTANEPVEVVPAPEVKSGPPPLSREEVADELGAVQIALDKMQDAFVGQFGRIVDEVAALKATVKSLQDAEAERQKEVDSLTPAASLHEMVRSRVIGSPETRVKGKDPLLTAGPKMSEPAKEGPTPVPLINALMGTRQ